MKANWDKLLRLRRMERLREVERLAAARDFARLEGALTRAGELARRSAMLAKTHSGGEQSVTGDELHSRSLFTTEVSILARLAATECKGAEVGAQAARSLLASASHRRDRVSERAQTLSKELAFAKSAAQNPVLARKLNRNLEAGG